MTELAIDLWSDRRRARLMRLCARLAGDRDAAEDLAQETLLEAWRNVHKLDDPAGMDRWLAAIARHVCLRWLRSRSREPARAPEAVGAALADPRADLELELERSELSEVVDRALGLIAADAREVLLRRYVHDATHAEIAAFLGISEDAVSMRLTRGKLQLRRLLGPETPAWVATRVRCATCGVRTLEQRRTAQEIAFRCPGCDPGALSHHVDLTNPFFERLMTGIVRPTAILGRLAGWSRRYFAGGTAAATCTGCGARTAIVLDEARHGLRATCEDCGRAVSSSVRGLAAALPEVRALRRAHPRARIGRVRVLDNVVAVGCAEADGGPVLEAVFDRDTLRLLALHA